MKTQTPKTKGKEKMKATREIRIVIFKGKYENKDAGILVWNALLRCQATYKAHDEKDYGKVIVANVPYDQAARLETMIGNIAGATY